MANFREHPNLMVQSDFDLALVIKGTTNLPLIIDYIQLVLKVTYVFSLLATLQSAKQASWHETRTFLCK